MQTVAEKHLIRRLSEFLQGNGQNARILNLGAAQSTVIENHLVKQDLTFVCDRCDVDDCKVEAPFAGEAHICPLEQLEPFASEAYDAAFANFVLEHVADPESASREMARILKPGGRLILTLSNPQAPEFVLASVTPLGFHQLVKGSGEGKEAHAVEYAYGSVDRLRESLERAGLRLVEETRFPATFSYLYRFPVLSLLSRAYDASIEKMRLRRLMGHACLTLEKPGPHPE
ncbi:MAG: class I SAM-dependent methyltransferase [Candidatus Eisenbacteria bacterium]|uniref:Class I SAM-dependent methyltransferase n=1 Tax=Eiseniibacteriota bacterium TaxID=2212470 RepID=A0A956LVF5_UNCEI|nr:class I SAM-dependent methyltransferase [Candidatus Eisenbacteria bacterium]